MDEANTDPVPSTIVEEVTVESTDPATAESATDCTDGQNKRAKLDSDASRRSKQAVSVQNSRSWKQIQAKIEKWVERTQPSTPSFIFMYWKTEQGGRPNLVWAGPSHMEDFVADEAVQTKFLSVAQGRPGFCQLSYDQPEGSMDIDHPLEREPIVLFSDDVQDYTADVLYLILPRIMNPYRKKGFYQDAENTPDWFPQDIAFRAPTHKHADEGKYKVQQMQKILQAFLDNCANYYKIDPQAGEEGLMRKFKVANKNDNTSRKPISPRDHPEGSPMDYKTDVNKALGFISLALDWEDLKRCVSTISFDFTLVHSEKLATVRDIPGPLWDNHRQVNLSQRIPNSLHAIKVSPDGNCLFHAVSIALFGSEEKSALLRLASVCHAVEHYEHYLKMYQDVVCDIGDAQQLLCTMISSDIVYDQRPTDEPAVIQLLEFMLQKEIHVTARLGAYSGPLQIQFVSGATRHTISQYSETENFLLHPMYPCQCLNDTLEDREVSIMWVKNVPDSVSLNHIIPLVPKRASLRAIPTPGPTVSKPAPLQISYGHCLMIRYGQCAIALEGDEADETCTEGIEWITCDNCGGWYHMVCIGVCKAFLSTNPFYCMCSSSVSTSPDTVFEAKGRRDKGVIIKFSDVRSLYPKQGITDAVIDYYVRCYQPLSPAHFVVSSLSYSAITDTLNRTYTTQSEKEQRIQQRFRSTCGRNLTEIIADEMIIFPCRVRSEWHWIVVVVILKKNCALVLDSYTHDQNKLEPYSIQAVKDIEAFLQIVLRSVTLSPHPYKVPQQTATGNDCGIHIIHNIHVLLKHTPESIFAQTIPNEEFVVNPALIRTRILTEFCRHNTEYMAVKQKEEGTGVLRRSTRTKEQDSNTHDNIMKQKIINSTDENLQLKKVAGKGMGVFAAVSFEKGAFLCEYTGELIKAREGYVREEGYANVPDAGSFLIYFHHNGEHLCIDATKDDHRYGRMVNHSKKVPNALLKVFTINGVPRLCLMALRNIQIGEELLYDYGERRKEVIESNPWLMS